MAYLILEMIIRKAMDEDASQIAEVTME